MKEVKIHLRDTIKGKKPGKEIKLQRKTTRTNFDDLSTEETLQNEKNVLKKLVKKQTL